MFQSVAVDVGRFTDRTGMFLCGYYLAFIYAKMKVTCPCSLFMHVIRKS